MELLRETIRDIGTIRREAREEEPSRKITFADIANGLLCIGTLAGAGYVLFSMYANAIGHPIF